MVGAVPTATATATTTTTTTTTITKIGPITGPRCPEGSQITWQRHKMVGAVPTPTATTTTATTTTAATTTKSVPLQARGAQKIPGS